MRDRASPRPWSDTRSTMRARANPRAIAICEYVQAYLTPHPGDEDIVVGRAQAPR